MASSTPPDYVPPAVETQLFEIREYSSMTIAAVVAYAYDWLLSVSEEVAIVSKRGLSLSIAIYFFVTRQRVCPYHPHRRDYLGAHRELHINLRCNWIVLHHVDSEHIVLVSQSCPIMVAFGCCWLVTIALNILASASARAEHLPGTQLCLGTETKYFALPSSSSFVNDTLIFLAISYRLAADAATEHNWRSWTQSVINGKGLYHLSKSLMQHGQLYYASIILFFFANLVVMCSPLVSAGMHYSLINTYLGFTNLMARRIFRGTALGMMQDSPSSWNTARINAALDFHAPHRGRAVSDRAP